MHHEVKMQPGAMVTALVPRDGHIDLFATGTDGAVWSTWWEAPFGWQSWFLVLPLGPNPNFLTHHYDNSRSGAYVAETRLKPANVHSASFGRLYERGVELDISAPPL